MTPTKSASPQALNPAAAALFSGFAVCFLAMSGSSCSFLSIIANSNETLQVSDDQDSSEVEAEVGIFCSSGLYDLEGEWMMVINRVLFIIAVTLLAISTLVLLGITAVPAVKPTYRTWRVISGLTALSTVIQTPIFLMFEIPPCVDFKSSQSCTLSLGSYFLVGSLLASLTVVLITVCLDPPVDNDWTVKRASEFNNGRFIDTDRDVTTDESAADLSFLSMLGACIRKLPLENNRSEPEGAVSTSSSSSMKCTSKVVSLNGLQLKLTSDELRIESDIEQGIEGSLSNNESANPNHKDSGEEQTPWVCFPSIYDTKTENVSIEPKRQCHPIQASTKPPNTSMADIAPELEQALSEKKPSKGINSMKSSIFRCNVLSSPPCETSQPRQESEDTGKRLHSDMQMQNMQERQLMPEHSGKSRLPSPIRASFLKDGGGSQPLLSKRGKVSRGYSLLDDDEDLERILLQSPPLEIVTIIHMLSEDIDNDDDSIDLGFGVINDEEDDKMEDYFQSIKEIPTTVAIRKVMSTSDGIKNKDEALEDGPVFVQFLPIAEESDTQKTDFTQQDCQSDGDRQINCVGELGQLEHIVAEVLKRRNGRRTQKRRWKKSSGCSISAASSQPSLLEVTIEEETTEDLLRENSLDQCREKTLKRTHSAPNLVVPAQGKATVNCKTFDCENLSGINSHRVVVTHWSDENKVNPIPSQLMTKRIGIVAPNNSCTIDGYDENYLCDGTVLSDPTERARKARTARIQRLQREKEHLLISSGESCGPSGLSFNHQPLIRQIKSAGDILDLTVIKSHRPKGAEYGPEEVSL